MDAPRYFVDEQRSGPYAFWHHKHTLEPVDGGTVMHDLVHYRLAADPFSRPVHDLVVRPRLVGIFECREKKLREMFG